MAAPTITTVDDATRLGLAVLGFLGTPPVDPLVSSTDTAARRERIGLSLQYLEAVDLLTPAQGSALRDFVSTGTTPPAPDGPPLLTVGGVLVSTVLHLPDGEGLFGDAIAALGHVVDASIGGYAHGGAWAALCCSCIAAMHVMQGIKDAHPTTSLEAIAGIKDGLRNGFKNGFKD